MLLVRTLKRILPTCIITEARDGVKRQLLPLEEIPDLILMDIHAKQNGYGYNRNKSTRN
jgi:hypothetical protein